MFEIFNYLAIVLSIVVGLGLTTALDALGNIIKYRQNIKIYWVAVLWEIGVLLILLQHWFGIWDYQSTQDWTYTKFLLLLLPSISLYVASHLAFPEIVRDKKIDLEDFYFRNRAYFFGAGLAYFVFDSLSSSLIHYKGDWLTLGNGFRLLGVVITIASARSDNRRFHAAMSLLAITALIAYILVFSTEPMASYL